PRSYQGPDGLALAIIACPVVYFVWLQRRRRYTTRSDSLIFSPRTESMPLTIEAIYENGVLKPAQPLPLAEHARVQVTIERRPHDLRRSCGRRVARQGEAAPPTTARRAAESDALPHGRG